MKISIDTVAKTVTIEYATINELQNIKSAIESVGGNPDEYSVTQLQSTVFYPSYPVPFYPYYGTNLNTNSAFGWKTEKFETTGTCNIESPLN